MTSDRGVVFGDMKGAIAGEWTRRRVEMLLAKYVCEREVER